MTEIAPGHYVPDPGAPVPEIVVADVVRVPARHGQPVSYRVVPRWDVMARVSEKLLVRLGLGENGWNTLRRLMRAGFVQGTAVAPATTLLDLTSWENHLQAVQEDPEFWDADSPAGAENLRRYRESLRG
jgi:hypothetical protein